jgi:molecular chaperone DnaK (HSP70)
MGGAGVVRGIARYSDVVAGGGRVAANSAVTGESAATITGKSVHRQLAAERRASGDFDLMNQPIVDAAGNPIQVTRRVDLMTGQTVTQSGLQSAVPDAVRYDRNLILDDKPLGRPISKDRQEVIRFIRAYEESQGTLPKTVAIQRYDPATGRPVVTELYKPSDFLPPPRKR